MLSHNNNKMNDKKCGIPGIRKQRLQMRLSGGYESTNLRKELSGDKDCVEIDGQI